jgi:hypothetical protein
MIISDKQHEANRQNAQQSTGPKTSEGKAAVRLNALTYGLRARSILIFEEDPEEYKQLWADLVADWQPQDRTERLYLEQIATSQWLLARIATGESRIYEANIKLAEQFALLREVAVQRARFERSFISGLRELKQLQKERRAQPQQHAQRQPPVEAKPTGQAAAAPVQHPVMQWRTPPRTTRPSAPQSLPIPVSNLPPLIFDNRTPRHNGYAITVSKIVRLIP